MPRATKLSNHLGSEAPMPVMMKPKPMVHLDAEEIDGLGTPSLGQVVTLTVTGKITAISEDEMGDEEKATRTHLTLRLTKNAKVASDDE